MFGKKWSYMIGTRLCDLRKMRNMTQKELAEKLSLSVNSISMYERGMSTPNDDVKIKIAQIFHVSLDYLLGNVDEKIQNPSSLRSELIMMKSIPPEAQAEVRGFTDYLKEKYHIDCACYTIL